jgi:hypothetical protein
MTAVLDPSRVAAELPKHVMLGAIPAAPDRHLSSGDPSLDDVLGGGFRRGRLSEIFGTASSGRTSLAYRLLAATTRAGEIAALVDCRDRLDPRRAAAAGIELSRLLWVRPRDEREALRACEILLGTRGFALVVLDLADGLPPFLATRFGAAWTRLARLCEGGEVALVVLGHERLTAGAATLCLRIRDARPVWPKHSLRPQIFAGIAGRAEIVRLRAATPKTRDVALASESSSEIRSETRR